VRRALDPRHVGLDPCRELHRVQMAPPARLAVIRRPGRPAVRTWVRPGPASTRTITRCPVMSTSTPATVHGAVSPRSARYSSMSRMAPILLDRSIAAGHPYPHDFPKSQITFPVANTLPHRASN
jgi:hypothetical protein